jgi:hypothetical protein
VLPVLRPARQLIARQAAGDGARGPCSAARGLILPTSGGDLGLQNGRGHLTQVVGWLRRGTAHSVVIGPGQTEQTSRARRARRRIGHLTNPLVSGRYLCTDLCTRRIGTGETRETPKPARDAVPPARRGQRHHRRPGETLETPVARRITQRRLATPRCANTCPERGAAASRNRPAAHYEWRAACLRTRYLHR